MAHETFNQAKHINYELLKYAMELVDKQEKKEEKIRKRLEQEKDPRRGLSSILGFGFEISWLWNLLLLLFLIAVWIIFRDDMYMYFTRRIAGPK